MDLGQLPVGSTVALFGGIYNNHLALHATVADARRRGAAAVFFLGDTGGFGPHPDRSVEGLRSLPVHSIAGNYDHSIGSDAADCACGYTDPRDNHFAQISYDYTLANTAAEHKGWLAALPHSARFELGGQRVLLCHGSPRKQNEFLWHSTTPAAYIDVLCREQQADLVCCTHTGMHWERRLADGRGVVNVGAIGRPANDGRTCVWYALLHSTPAGLRAELVPLSYDHEGLAREMRDEGLPAEFVETIETGWWTTCLEILPPRERMAGRY
ncbi:MAG: metallophosphoesterase family protein [Alphaproteobacteria bacterium]|nr:metallophosphoesterase family protein [Alphaproteobacteria bacterium]